MAEKVGVLACSGEEYLGGTLSRLAIRHVMTKLRPGRVSTLCLPLYIAGGEEEREFARKYPCIAVDACSKSCAERATVKYSGAVKDVLLVADVIGSEAALSKIVSARDLKPEHYAMMEKIAAAIALKVDAILAE
ncbi:MAG: putative zinc-binding protein [Negativicutes bacterium]|nr:putative zinc-binding protein [Negativicutes bacterium]